MLVTIHNFADEACEVSLTIKANGGERLVDLRKEAESRAGEDGVHRIALDAYGYAWYRVGELR